MPLGRRLKASYGIAALLLALVVSSLVACARSSSSDSSAELVRMAISLRGEARQGQWDLIKQSLVSEFQKYGSETLRLALQAGRSITDGWPIPEGDEWEVESHPEFTVLRVKDLPPLALVFRKDSQGKWKLDPGKHALVIAERITKGIPDYMSAGPTYEKLAEPPITSPREVDRRLDLTIESVYLREWDVDVNVLALSNQGKEFLIALKDISWSAGDQQGPVEVTWTQSQLNDGALVFPGASREGHVTTYMVTFTLKDVPEVDSIAIRYNNIRSEDVTFSVTHRFPRKSTTG